MHSHITMLKFQNPQYFYLLVLVVIASLLFAYGQYRRKQNIRKIGDVDLVRQLFRDVSVWRPIAKFVLLQLSFVCLVFAMARPQWGSKIVTRERYGIEAIIAIDLSNSMLAEDVRPNRLDKAKHLLNNMIDKMAEDKVGIVMFAGDAFVQMPTTTDKVSAKMCIDQLSPGMIEVQGTDIAQAIKVSSTCFSRDEDVSRAIFVITDGEDNEGGAVDAATEAAQNGTRVYVLGIGNPNGAPIPVPGKRNEHMLDDEGNMVLSKLNEDMCRTIAQAGQGAYIYVDNSESAQIKLNEQLDNLSKSKLESDDFTEYEEQYQSFLIAALIFILLEVCILERRMRANVLSNLFNRK